MKRPFLTNLIRKLASRINAQLIVEPEFERVGQIVFANGKKAFFNNFNLNINLSGSAEIAKDKGYTKFFLRTFGYSTPEGETFFSDDLKKNIKDRRNIDKGFEYAKQLGFPVILKPNDLSQGTFVTKVYTKAEYYRTAKKIFRQSPIMLIEKFHEGSDYRIVVLDNKVISAYQRIPLSVIGDGRSTILELLQKKQMQFKEYGRDTNILFDDFRISMNLRRLKLRLNEVLQKGKKIFLLANANLSTGGSAVDVTNLIHPDFAALAVSVTRDMGLRLCGVDILTEDIALPLSKLPPNYVILEINGSPGLDNYASIGKSQNRIVENLYFRILKALEDRST